MPSAKPPYQGQRALEPVADFSPRLRKALRQLFPGVTGDEFSAGFGEPGEDAFVARILAEAWWAKCEMREPRPTKEELKAERADLLRLVGKLEDRLRKVSPDLDALLGVDADPLGCAAKLAILRQQIEAAGEAIERLGRVPRKQEVDHGVAVELAVRVLRALQEFGIPAHATGDPHLGYASVAVRVLELIGNEIGIVRSAATWRDLVVEAKDAAPDLSD